MTSAVHPLLSLCPAIFPIVLIDHDFPLTVSTTISTISTVFGQERSGAVRSGQERTIFSRDNICDHSTNLYYFGLHLYCLRRSWSV
jgi:hypothetical protein